MNLRSTVSKMQKHQKRIYIFNLLKTQNGYVKVKTYHSSISTAQGSQLVSPLPPAPWPLTSQRDNEIRDVLERYAQYYLVIHQILQILQNKQETLLVTLLDVNDR